MLHNLTPGNTSPSERAIMGALANALRTRGRPNTDSRIDSDGYVGRHDTLEAYARDVDERALQLLGNRWRPISDAIMHSNR